MEYEYELEEKQIIKEIILERNQDIKFLENEMQDLQEIYLTLSFMLNEQGRLVENSRNNLEKSEIQIIEAETCLDNSLKYKLLQYEKLKNLGIIIGGISLGAFGFLGGPVIGMVTMLSSVSISSGLLIFSNNLVFT